MCDGGLGCLGKGIRPRRFEQRRPSPRDQTRRVLSAASFFFSSGGMVSAAASRT